MAIDKYQNLRLQIIEMDFPNTDRWDYSIFQNWQNLGLAEAPSNTRSQLAAAFQRYKQVRDYSPHQVIYFHLFKLAERDGQVEHEDRLNHPGSLLHEEDYQFWCKADFWTDHEFIGLIVGRAPKRISSILSHILTPKTECAQHAAKLQLLLERAKRKRHLDWEESPRALIAWAMSKGVKLPEVLLKVADSHGLLSEEEVETKTESAAKKDYGNVLPIKPEQPIQSPKNPAGLGTKERDSLLKMVIGMGIAGYAHDPDSRRNSTAKEISDDLAERGLSLDEDTIRKYLKAGAEMLPREPKPNSLGKTNSESA